MRNLQKLKFVLAVITAFNAVGLIMIVPAWANNIQVQNMVLTNQETATGLIDIQFDISWDNSWKLLSTQPGNWDAAWIFVKWKLKSESNWSHCTLSTNDIDHTAPTGSMIDASFSKDNNGKGVFIYRSSEGAGSNEWGEVRLQWNYLADGMGDNDSIDMRVFAIEMVYVPQQGEFYVGDTDNDQTSCFHDGDDSGPYLVTSEGAITVGTGDGELYYSYSSEGGDQSGPVPAAFPKGFNSFYCMKYEMSQGQYTDFLNTLNRAQQNARTGTDVSTDSITNVYVMGNSHIESKRNTILCPSSGNGTTEPIVFSTSTPDRACNWLAWMDGAAYADWAGLRPMTELEFEKTCRGTQTPVDDEYAWGNANIASSTYTLSNDGQPDEIIATNYASDPTGNAFYIDTSGSISGPLRCGIFAMSDSTRVEAGSGYYGVMEMSGNVWERTVTLGNATGRGFSGTHGNGVLFGDGHADVPDWPGYSSGEVTGSIGSGLRGGGGDDGSGGNLCVSIRNTAAWALEIRTYYMGFRAVRTE